MQEYIWRSCHSIAYIDFGLIRVLFLAVRARLIIVQGVVLEMIEILSDYMYRMKAELSSNDAGPGALRDNTRLEDARLLNLCTYVLYA